MVPAQLPYFSGVIKEMTDNYTKAISKQKPLKSKLAKLIRVVSVPPFMVSAMFLIFYFDNKIFANFEQLICSLIFFAIIPVLAYPICAVVPKLKEKGREGERNLAFILSIAGYTLAMGYAFFAQLGKGLMLIYLSYFYSVIILTVFNKLIKKRASGHTCAIAGPLIFLVFFEGVFFSIPCVSVFMLVVWASLKLKRHTVEEIILGSMSALFAFSTAHLTLMNIIEKTSLF